MIFFVAMLSAVFAYFMFKGKVAQDWVIELYQERLTRTGRDSRMAPETRFAILRWLDKCLWASWFVLLACWLAFRLVGDLTLGSAIAEVMIAFVLGMIPLRLWIAAALFWPGRQIENKS